MRAPFYSASRSLVGTAVAISVANAVAASAQTQTVVTLGFDDDTAEQSQVGAMLASRGLNATFFVNSGRVGTGGFMTWDQIAALQAQGHEIAGHTVSHVKLTTVSSAEQRREICDDRAALLSRHFPAVSFAYPFGDVDASVEAIVRACGYSSGRAHRGSIPNPTSSCTGHCTWAEKIPPVDPFNTQSPSSIQSTWTLADLQAMVTRAEQNGGGWLQLTFHRICSGCATYSTSPELLVAFLDWLRTRAARGTVVRTVAGVIQGGAPPPPVAVPPPPVPGPPPPPVGTAGNLLQNPSFESDANGDGVPDCWQRTGYGSNSYTWTRTTDAHSGGFAERVEIKSLSSGDRKLVPLKDLASCAPAATPGKRYVASAWYKSTTPVRFAAYMRSTSASWSWWAQSAEFPGASIWTQVRWAMPAVPAGVTGISVGLSIRRVGSMTVDDQELFDPSAATVVAAGGPGAATSARTDASGQTFVASTELVSQEPFFGEEDGENEHDEAAFAEATVADATGCKSGGAGPVSVALMAAALASRARARRRNPPEPRQTRAGLATFLHLGEEGLPVRAHGRMQERALGSCRR